MNIKTKLLGATVAASMLLAGAVGVAGQVSAQEPGTDSPPAAEQGARRGNFLARVAEKLGITVEQLQQAMQAAANDAVDEALANGQITQEQADKARERIASGKGPRGPGEHRQDRREHRRDLVRKGIIESSAMALNMTVDELKVELQSGDSIADVSAEQGVSLDIVKAQITSDAQAKLDEAVASGKVTKERADQAMAKLAEKLDDILNKSKAPPPAS